MAKLPRTTQKIFGKNAPENQITTFGSIKAGTPVYTQSASQIMNSAFEGGWSEAVEDDYAPYRQDRNAVDTAITQQLGYLFQDGIPEWDSGTTYYKGSVVKVVNGNALTFYKSITDNNTSSVSTTNKWHKMLEINSSNQIVSPTINTPTISGGSMSNGTFSNPTFSGTVNVPLASQSSSTDSTIAASIGWVNNPSLSSNVTHKTGSETIGGSKTFTYPINIQSGQYCVNINQPDLAKGSNPESTLGKSIAFYDNSGSTGGSHTFGNLQFVLTNSGETRVNLLAYKNEAGSSTNGVLGIRYPTSGDAYTQAPTPATSDNSTKIATTAFVKANLTGAISNITTSNLTASKVLVSNSSGKIDVSAVTDTELSYLSGVTGAIQTQINSKQATITGAATSITSSNLTASRALVSNSSGKVAVSSTTSTELGYVHGVTSNIQTQINTIKTTLDGLLGSLYPVGSIYIGTQSTCPLSTLISGSTWTLVSSGKALWTGDGTNGNTTINAGLPNVTGYFDYAIGSYNNVGLKGKSGAFTNSTATMTVSSYRGYDDSVDWATKVARIEFDASSSNAIYGNSTTVQPPAYVVNVWRRTA